MAFKGLAASTTGDGVGIVDLESPTHEIVDVVDRTSSKKVHGDWIDNNLDLSEGKAQIGLMWVALQRHSILVS